MASRFGSGAKRHLCRLVLRTGKRYRSASAVISVVSTRPSATLIAKVDPLDAHDHAPKRLALATLWLSGVHSEAWRRTLFSSLACRQAPSIQDVTLD
jgi:hypothetical protein